MRMRAHRTAEEHMEEAPESSVSECGFGVREVGDHLGDKPRVDHLERRHVRVTHDKGNLGQRLLVTAILQGKSNMLYRLYVFNPAFHTSATNQGHAHFESNF